jgi:ATP/maltotriose-dependent transcriptional regulator MalT
LEQHGFLVEAIHHAFASTNFKQYTHKHQKRISHEILSIAPAHSRTVLATFDDEKQPTPWNSLSVDEDVLIEKLSKREQDVLTLIAEGLSNQEIAQKLVVTVSTIKTHLNNIYAKMNVHTRLQAVTKAYDLGLLHRNAPGTEQHAQWSVGM